MLEWRLMSAGELDPRLSQQDLEVVLDSISDAVFTINRDFVVTSFNRAAEATTGLRRALVLGRHCYDVLHSTICDYVAECPMTRLFDERAPHDGREIDIVRAGQPGAGLRVSVHVFRDPAGVATGGVELFQPFTPGDAPPHGRLAHPRERRSELPILDASERRVIEDVLRRNNWNRSKACEVLRLSRTTLWRKMRKLGIGSQTGARLQSRTGSAPPPA